MRELGWQVQAHCVVISNAEFAESLKYLAKPYIRGGVRATENRHVSVRRQPMDESPRSDQVQDQGQQYSRCRKLSQVTQSVSRTQPSTKVDNPPTRRRQQISQVKAAFVRHTFGMRWDGRSIEWASYANRPRVA